MILLWLLCTCLAMFNLHINHINRYCLQVIWLLLLLLLLWTFVEPKIRIKYSKCILVRYVKSDHIILRCGLQLCIVCYRVSYHLCKCFCRETHNMCPLITFIKFRLWIIFLPFDDRMPFELFLMLPVFKKNVIFTEILEKQI